MAFEYFGSVSRFVYIGLKRSGADRDAYIPQTKKWTRGLTANRDESITFEGGKAANFLPKDQVSSAQ